MSWLRSAGSPLGRGTSILLQGNLVAPAWRATSLATARVPRGVKDPTTQTSGFASRSLSTQRSAKDVGQGSRFKRSEASLAETPAAAARENIQTEHALGEPDAAESVAAASPGPSTRPQVPPQASPQAAPKPRKPVDTSSKEYKQAASRYIRFVVGLPFLLVTSYFLYERGEYLPRPGH
ncbi:hypothetical protein C8A00DRAFT_14856 [Chaetomidium leptoderma]|uniref:Uncharacterized protein n=1 Tax=Chaetomidium leptoderma TaxID=669021 RepID=A0AAN6VLX0_9PEZI|nr:hypothetical protein C8A00DRAFT_14856 [Chaetomidium leptoderma]